MTRSYWIMIGLILTVAVMPLWAQTDRRPMRPIFEGQDDLKPPLKLLGCDGWVQSQEGAYGLSSKTITIVHESWSSPPAKQQGDFSRGVIIKRWYFDNPKDIPYFPTIPGKLTGSPFPGWDKTPEFGERSLRYGIGNITFAKGNVLVSISLNSNNLSATRYRPYIDKIAAEVEAALVSGINKP